MCCVCSILRHGVQFNFDKAQCVECAGFQINVLKIPSLWSVCWVCSLLRHCVQFILIKTQCVECAGFSIHVLIITSEWNVCWVCSILGHGIIFFISALCVECAGFQIYPLNIFQMKCVSSLQHFATWCPIFSHQSSVFWDCRAEDMNPQTIYSTKWYVLHKNLANDLVYTSYMYLHSSLCTIGILIRSSV